MEPTRTRPTLARRLLGHLRRTFIAGGLIVIPVVATYWVLRFLFNLIDGVLRPPLEQALGLHVPGLGAIVLILLVYLLGLLGANVLGRRAIHLGQRVLLRVPLVSTVYGAAKALMEALFGPPGVSALRRVVLVQYPGPGLWTIGFLMGTTRGDWGETLAVVYVPTAPTPQTGWVALVPIAQVYETDMSVQAAMRLVFSGGVLSPASIGRRPLAV
ncbi:MAG: DUF502 domain-containing protein [Chloroflexi bacterium]|nr:DUF502 domain-containing protein [Chloroflexota bacterium]